MANDTTPYLGNDGKYWENIDTSKTLTAADNGITQNVIADGITVTLPATAIGLAYTIRNGGVPASSAIKGTGTNGTALITVAPNASDQIAGIGFTAADNKAALNTKATSKVGDFITLIGDGTTAVGWNVLASQGTWARQP